MQTTRTSLSAIRGYGNWLFFDGARSFVCALSERPRPLLDARLALPYGRHRSGRASGDAFYPTADGDNGLFNSTIFGHDNPPAGGNKCSANGSDELAAYGDWAIAASGGDETPATDDCASLASGAFDQAEAIDPSVTIMKTVIIVSEGTGSPAPFDPAAIKPMPDEKPLERPQLRCPAESSSTGPPGSDRERTDRFRSANEFVKDEG